MFKKNLFYADQNINREIDWDDLLHDLASVKSFPSYCYESDFYTVFKNIICSLLMGQEITLLDSDFNKEEINHLIGDTNILTNTNIVDKNICQIPTKVDLLLRIRNVSPAWRMNLFTSGTTGLPKKVTHTFETITRFVKQLDTHKESVWGFAYNPTHMAGVQVFFQALLNGNPIIRLFGLAKDQIMQSINDYSISHISATPTFYRLLLPINDNYRSVIRITSGGEKFDDSTINALKRVFPSAKITNVYASTEAGTLLASVGDEFTLKTEYLDLMKIVENELLIHTSLMGYSDIVDGDWYNTGDLVEIISENPIRFRFLSRKNEMINVGGYKVNPIEVEDAIRSIEGVINVRVYPKSNSVLGNIICCDVVKNKPEIDESYIRIKLQAKLQEYKIPRLVRFVDSIGLTRTGKIKRNQT